ncbi:reticulon-like protein B21 [Asparagus officinalis]|uniref:reticulon-like protein B21 n=1 Tax=Asparagus officinalis TaxID=4686 RepID=UPI00098E0018|nr:reticulon-like protein B21 [Asparagus officinalis]
MQPGAKRRARTNGVAPGSIWDTRIKMDEMEGGIKVFNGESEEDNNNTTNADGEEEEGAKVFTRLRRDQSDGTGSKAGRRKRRNWKTPDKNPVELMKEEEEEEVEGEVKDFDDKEIDLPKPKVFEVVEKKLNQVIEPKSIEVQEEKKIHPVMGRSEAELDPMKSQQIEVEDETVDNGGSEAAKAMQSIVDLVMWRDISKSAFVFGFGTFILFSSSYTKDLEVSLLSAIAYLGLVYLALIFLYKSVFGRGALNVEERDERYIIGEEEAISTLRFLLPYVNELLIKIKAFFSGDPATTMKMAVLLFLVAKCGSSITVWTLAKLAFLGIFTIPKILSSYSLQPAKYGKIWVERFRDGWGSCPQKKAVAALIFILIWSVFSTVARIWAVFMLIVAVKLYQQCTTIERNLKDHQQQQELEKTALEEQEKEQEHSSNAGLLKSAGKRPHHQQKGAGPKREMIKVKKLT